ncbi:MAG: DNA repair protein RadA [Sphaerochaeta sp.]|jgi:hypothetical protein|nr:DNA repair protein RadA [Sphaerochaeta sp.]
MTDEKQPSKEDALIYVCPHCEKGFRSKNALNGHLAVCKAKPDRDIPREEETDEDESEGIDLFGDEDRASRVKITPTKDAETEEDDDGYQCGGCGYTSSREFHFCPECGEENEFD